MTTAVAPGASALISRSIRPNNRFSGLPIVSPMAFGSMGTAWAVASGTLAASGESASNAVPGAAWAAWRATVGIWVAWASTWEVALRTASWTLGAEPAGG